jgi:DNA helicase-2/ATP-dependent DNA helicase PcrA
VVLGIISRAKNDLVDDIEFGRRASDYFSENVAQAYRRYQEKLVEQNALDFDDMLMLTVKLFEIAPEVLSQYQDRFHYISVDEYQDTNHAQYVLTNLLAQKHQNICVVGDSDQSIYRFRGADFRNIINFERDYPNAKVVLLEQNYRSTQSVLEVANHVIKNNLVRKHKNLWTHNPAGNLPCLFEAEDEHAEAFYVVGEIKRLAEQFAYHEFAVLYRTNAQSRVLEEVFMRAGVPYRIFSGVKFYERREIKDILSYLRIIVNPRDDLSAKRVLTNVIEGVGKTSLMRLEAFAKKHNLSLVGAFDQASQLDAPPKVKLALAELHKKLNRLRADATEEPASIIIEKVLIQSGYKRKLEEEGTEESLSRAENIKELITVAKEYEKTGDDPSLAGFLAQVSLVAEANFSDVSSLQNGKVNGGRSGENESKGKKSEKEGAAVSLMTLHSAKGLEFPVVFVVGMEEGIFPHYRSVNDAEELEEERRLCYVGITRAKQRLYLVAARSRLIFGETWNNGSSRFIREIPETLLDIKMDDVLGFGKSAAENGTGSKEKEGDEEGKEKEKFFIGDWVNHKKWGRGRVLEIEGEGLDSILLVKFDSVGEKNLLLRYAPLTIA